MITTQCPVTCDFVGPNKSFLFFLGATEHAQVTEKVNIEKDWNFRMHVN